MLTAAMDYSIGPCIDTHGQHYGLLRHVLGLKPRGTALEFGVGKGESLRLIAAHMPVIGFDTFQGLPHDWRPGYPAGSFAQPHPPAVDNADLVIGLFEDTLAGADFTDLEIGLVHLDADLYSSTATALRAVGPHLHTGCFVVFDEWHGYAGAENDEQRAWREFVDRTNIAWSVVGHSFQQWAIRLA